MDDATPWRIVFAPHFLKRLTSIETFLHDADASTAYDALLDAIESKVIPNLRRFPAMGRLYSSDPPLSVEAMTRLAKLPLRGARELREYLHGDYLILYHRAPSDSVVHLLSIRHHREYSFGFRA